MKFKVFHKDGGEFRYHMYLDQHGRLWEIKEKFGRLIKTELPLDKFYIVFEENHGKHSK